MFNIKFRSTSLWCISSCRE